MEVQPLQIDLASPEASDAFLGNEFHIVCHACNGLTFYNSFAVNTGGLSFEEAGWYADQVNDANEVGTLYPRLNLTIIPWYANNDRCPDKEMMKRHIHDCFTANENYVRCPEMIFLFDWTGISNMAKTVLDEETRIFTDFHFTKRISCATF